MGFQMVYGEDPVFPKQVQSYHRYGFSTVQSVFDIILMYHTLTLDTAVLGAKDAKVS